MHPKRHYPFEAPIDVSENNSLVENEIANLAIRHIFGHFNVLNVYAFKRRLLITDGLLKESINSHCEYFIDALPVPVLTVLTSPQIQHVFHLHFDILTRKKRDLLHSSINILLNNLKNLLLHLILMIDITLRAQKRALNLLLPHQIQQLLPLTPSLRNSSLVRLPISSQRLHKLAPLLRALRPNTHRRHKPEKQAIQEASRATELKEGVAGVGEEGLLVTVD